jgi:hypothetical protein
MFIDMLLEFATGEDYGFITKDMWKNIFSNNVKSKNHMTITHDLYWDYNCFET